MPWKSLGLVTVPVPGTPIQATANVSGSAAWGENTTVFACLAILFQADPANTGKTYIGDDASFKKSTGEGRLAVLAIPTDNSIPSASATIPNAPAALNANDYWIDADKADEGVTVSILI